MTFLNPLILIGLAAATIPILLHLFNLRKLEKIDFSTLSFLRELQKTKIRKLKLRQYLLLALRTLLVILIVTAFSRPTLKTSSFGAINPEAKTTAILIIDNSYSMTSVDGDGQLLKQAKEGAIGALRLLKDGDDAFIVRPSDVRAATSIPTNAGLRDFAAVKAQIEDIEPSYIHATLEDALRFSARLVSSSKNLNKEVYVFSDFKIGSLKGRSHNEGNESIFPAGVRVFLFPLGKNTRENLGVESVELANSLFSVGTPLTIKTRVRNWGTRDQKNDVVSVFVNGTRVAQKALDIRAQNWAETEFTVTPASTGFLDGTVELQEDDLSFDNRRPFAVYIPKQLRVLLVGTTSDLRYLRLALSVLPASGEAIIKLSSIAPDRLSTNEIESADIVVLANIKTLSTAQQTQVRTFVESGGGVIFFPGSQVDSASFRATWVRCLGAPPISSVTPTNQQPGQSASLLDFDRIDSRHPIFQGMFAEQRLHAPTSRSSVGEQQPQIESPIVHAHVRYQSNVQTIPIIVLSDGSPFMAEERVKKGVVILFSVSATTDWSDFPLKGLFVPLIHSSVIYASQRRTIPPELTVGQEADLSLQNVVAGKVVIQNPAKTDIASDLVSADGGSAVRFRGTSLPGIYSVRSGNTMLRQFVVTLDPDESNTIPASRHEIEMVVSHLGVPMNAVKTITQRSDFQQVVVQSRVGIELWKYLVAAALLIALTESLVARTAKKESGFEQHSSDPLADTVHDGKG